MEEPPEAPAASALASGLAAPGSAMTATAALPVSTDGMVGQAAPAPPVRVQAEIGCSEEVPERSEGLQPSALQYPYFHEGWTTALNQGFMLVPFPPSTPAAPAQNQSFAAVEGVEPAVMKESQGDGQGGSLPAGRRRKLVPSRTKLSNFSPKEDVLLVKSWLEISCDTGQKKEGLWARISSRYNSKRGSFPERSVRSLQSRWDTIKAEAIKFAGYMANVPGDNPSGMSDADKTSLALANFADIEEHSFAFMHCWDLLKDEAKWMEVHIRGARHRDDNGIADADQIAPASNNIDLDPETPTSQSSGSKRPMGKDAAKKAVKKSASSSPSDSSQYVSKLQDLSMQKLSIWQEENEKKGSCYEQMAAINSQGYDELRQHNRHMAAIEEEKVRLMRKKADREQTKEEERILGVDLDKCLPQLRKYYDKKQKEILQSIGAIDSQRYDELCQHNRHIAAIEEEKLWLMRKQADREQTKEEERILGVDLDKCLPRLRKYYHKKQKEILQSIGAIDSQRYDELNQHMAAIEEEKLRLMHKKADRERAEEEERILGVDLDKCLPRLRKYYDKKQKEILQSIGADVDSSEDPCNIQNSCAVLVDP